MKEIWLNNIEEAKYQLDQLLFYCDFDKLEEISHIILDAYMKKKNILIAGNGGSHADALHFAEELTGKFQDERSPLGAIALGEATHMSCTSNDFGFQHVFERQVRALGKNGDVLILLSTSGNSENLILAAMAAKVMNIKTIALLGKDGGALKDIVDIHYIVPGETSDRIQELHMLLLHTLVEVIENELFPVG